MSDATTFYRNLVSTTNTFIQNLQALDTLQDRLTTEPGLAALAAAAANTSGRPDLTAQDFTNAHDAINQILFAFNSGSPPQKAALYKLL